jgi:hypothetical protein
MRSLGSNSESLVEMQGKAAYTRPKVVGHFPGPYASGSYVHQATLFSLVGNKPDKPEYPVYVVHMQHTPRQCTL